jgi:hypothetical protein
MRYRQPGLGAPGAVDVADQVAFFERMHRLSNRLGTRWCTACHVFSVTQREANAYAPPFEAVAKGQTSTSRVSRHSC